MTQDLSSSCAKPPQPTLLDRLFSLVPTKYHNSENDDTSGRDPKFCRPRIIHTLATEVLKTHTAFTQLSVEPNTLPSSTNWETHTAAKSKAWRDCKNTIDFLNMALVRDQKDHDIPTGTEIDGLEAGTVLWRETRPSKAFLQMCTALSQDPTLNTKAKIVEWSKEQPEFSLLSGTLKTGKWLGQNHSHSNSTSH